MPSNNANLLMSFIVASTIFNFFAYYINDVSVTRYKNNKTCYSTKTLDLCQRIIIETSVSFIACIMLSKLLNVKRA